MLELVTYLRFLPVSQLHYAGYIRHPTNYPQFDHFDNIHRVWGWNSELLKAHLPRNPGSGQAVV